MNSDLRASLLELGFNLSQARAAVAAGNTTVEAAAEWIFTYNDSISQQQGAGNRSIPAANTLKLGSVADDDAMDVDLQRALAESAMPQPSQPLPSAPAVHTSDTQDDISGEPAKKVKINIVRAPQPSQVIAPLPVHSRHNEEEKMAQNATRLAEATKISIEAKRLRMEARLARERALAAAKEDREKQKLRHIPASIGNQPPQNTAPTPVQVSTQAVSSTSGSSLSNATVQLRLKNGSVIKRVFSSTATLRDLFDLVRAEDRNIGSSDISLIQPFPRREFTAIESTLTLAEGGLCPSCSLNVFVQTPIPAPQPITPTTTTPGAWLTPEDIPAPNQPEVGQEEDLMDVDEEPDQAEEENGQDEDDDEDEDDENDADEDDDDEMMHALPVQFNPGHHGMPGRGRGRGRGGGMPFSGAGHSLAGGSGPTTAAPGDDSSTLPQMLTAEEADVQRRQRFLQAMENRARTQEQDQSQKPTIPSKHLKPKEIPSLRSRCAYEVAVMLTRSDAATAKNLKTLGSNVGSQVAETIVQELIKLKQLDQLSFKRLRQCPVVNMILDGYSRSTDSLMYTIGRSQAQSLTYLSLRECTFLTDKGFENLEHFEWLEYLDMSHCRITDKTLDFILTTLHLSATKVTSAGLARVIAESAWKSGLHTLDLSYCQGIAGPSVLVNLQELSNLRTLKLNNTRAFDSSPVRVPDSRAFARLLHVDLARTPINGQDLIALASTFKLLESLNLTECVNVPTGALEHCAEHLKALQHFNFPNREHDLLTVLPLSSRLPITHLDLTGFVFVGDEAILNLASATSLQMLSLSGTKLTDIGSSVLVHMSSLRELVLDRTDIGDKSMEYIRDLGRIEVLSLNRCRRLTTVGVLTLGRSSFFKLRLKRLNLGYNQYIHDEALAAFTVCNGLITLNLDHTDVSEQKALLLQNSLPCLTQLRIQGVTNGAVFEENPKPTFQ
ncbi:hypothetical protein BG005_010590 [Podila minutissima]|nr:hypothetical protein BG005_010590 [Podila minutissima]